MVEIINESWRQYLVRPSVEECDHLPSPLDLKRKILVKVKYVPPEAVKKKTAKSAAPSLSRARSSSSSSLSENQDLPVGEEMKKKKSAITEALSALGVYTRSYHFKSLQAPESSVPTHVFSLSENKFREVHDKEGDLLFTHNKRFLMRAFPSGMRVASSNLDPSGFWRKGVQIVALNWQKRDKGMMLNEAMFADSNGWVLKPRSFRGQVPDNAEYLPFHNTDKICLSISIKIFAGQKIPLPLGDTKPEGFRPYVKCELHVEKSNVTTKSGSEVKKNHYRQRTQTAKGCDPDFHAEEMVFPPAYGAVEELSFLR